MTALAKIIEIVEDQGLQAEVGYGLDLQLFLSSELPPAGSLTVYIQIGHDQPDRYYGDGKVSSWVGSFSVWLRSHYARGQEQEVYQEYLDLRTALDGAKYTGGTLKMVGGAPQIANGTAEPSLLIEART